MRADALAIKVAHTLAKVEAAKEEGVANFRRSANFKETLGARREEFTKLFLSIVRCLLA